ncbi:hypothetical protein [Sulfitobacter geojensis]|uniref:Uncharacterized protein n=1 Tax=Sulfitobacter geojensis TaxID=1342299 RepID=A0AAE3B6K0_9RHOB|nr:hypothetical protein [Sulfitobacter geojensis]MBM1689150.1 hypothetical protein [Sulfitobacter geojensis]MBM1693217.1 hypothetical protein [Sulfitobacter geojensis]MBM1705383.1 hypothetical protein [Sulfitobacter geojensis]MBM1709441.1 hypothetical protein [Sulfitobacter geojensis]MBM1713506.1 hypothetical protein [Sulfitobacter geojensis]
MTKLGVIAACAFVVWTSGAAAQQISTGTVRVQSGHFCAENKCVRFSPDLQSVSIQGRRAASVADYNLAANPVISAEQFRQIFSLALRQGGVNGNRG